MKINEILNENATGSLAPAVARTLPATFEFPSLKNTDPYLQYRMGVALASARTQEPFSDESAFGENMSIVGYTDADIETIELAMKLVGKEFSAGAKMITTKHSEEANDVNHNSPLKPKAKNQFGV